MAAERERSPRRQQAVASAIPLADFLLEKGLLDERSVDFLSKAPIDLASEVLLSLSPEVRNPSAFITKKLAPFLGAAGGAAASPRSFSGGLDGGAGYGSVAPAWEPAWEAPRRSRPSSIFESSSAAGGDSFTILGTTVVWHSQEQVVNELVSSGILDEGSADFLMQAPEAAAKDVLGSLGPEVRNPSALVTRKLKEMRQQGMLHASPGGSGAAAGVAEPIVVHHNGVPLTLMWKSKEQAGSELVRRGILDEGSADFLMKATELQAREIVSALTPDVRNPSAYVTRKCKEIVPRAGGYLNASAPTVSVFHEGHSVNIEWPSREVALGQMVSRGILDERSADFLLKVSEDAAFEIVSRLGPDVRNPSAYVTKEAKKLAFQ